VNQWLMSSGFSVGIDDCMTDANTYERVSSVIARALDTIEAVATVAKRKDGTVGPMPGIAAREVESYIYKLTNKVMDQAGRIVQESTTILNNSIHAMVTAGSKGNPINQAQMRGCV